MSYEVKERQTMKRLARDPRLWAIAAMMLALSGLHYIEWLGLAETAPPSSHFGLTRHSLDRILFLVPIIYAGYSFRLRAGIATASAAFAVMLPRVLLASPVPLDAILESTGVILVGVSSCLWFESRWKTREQKEESCRELETVEENLQTQVRLSRSNAKRLATLNAISGMVSRSLDPEQVLGGAIDLVMEVMEVEIALIFTLDKDLNEVKLAAHEGISTEFAQKLENSAIWENFNRPVIQKGQPELVEDVSQHVQTKEIWHEKIQSLLTVPLRAKGEITGTLCVGNRRPRQFLPEDVELLKVIGVQIGIAMENTRLYHNEKQMKENLRHYIEAITRAQEEERKRISRELHDETVQQLVALSHQLEEFGDENTRLNEADMTALTALQQRLKDAMRSIRLFSRDLRPPMIDDLGLLPAVEWLAGQLNTANAMNIEMNTAGIERRLAPDTELALFRIVQEALNNARRHARASQLTVKLEFGVDSIDVQVKDNGQGFKVPDSMGEMSKTGKLGLAGMAERAHLIGAELKIQSSPAAGTSISVHLPDRPAN
jgi:signal transduction histidine kinase